MTKGSRADRLPGTVKQKTAMMKIMRGVPVRKALTDAGYVKPNLPQVRKRKGWNELLDKYLPETTLVRAHKSGLEATRINMQTGEEYPDHNARFKYVELGYKLRGKMDGDGGGNTINIQLFSQEQLKRIASRVIEDDTLASPEPPHRLLDSNEPEIRTELAS